MVEYGSAGHTLVVGHQRTEVKPTAGSRSIFFADVGQAGNAGQVDDAQMASIRGCADAALYLQQEIGAAGDDTGIGSVGGFQCQRFVKGCRRGIKSIHGFIQQMAPQAGVQQSVRSDRFSRPDR